MKFRRISLPESHETVGKQTTNTRAEFFRIFLVLSRRKLRSINRYITAYVYGRQRRHTLFVRYSTANRKDRRKEKPKKISRLQKHRPSKYVRSSYIAFSFASILQVFGIFAELSLCRRVSQLPGIRGVGVFATRCPANGDGNANL